MTSEGVIELKRLTLNESKTLAKLANNKKIWENVRDLFPHPYDEEDALSFINSTLKEDPEVTFGIFFNKDLSGVIGIVPQNDVYRMSAEIGYWIGEEYWGREIATNAVKLITEYGFVELGLVRFFCGVYEFNKASMRVLEKNGFLREGISRKAVIKNDVLLDEYRFALTR